MTKIFKTLLSVLTKKAVVIGVASAVVVGGAATAGVMVYNNINEETTNLVEEITIEYENGEINVTGGGLKEDYSISIEYFDKETNEYESSFAAINSEENQVKALEVFDLFILNEKKEKVELENPVTVDLKLSDETKEANGEYNLWGKDFISVDGAKFSKSNVKFETTYMGRFIISKCEKVEKVENLSNETEEVIDENQEENKLNQEENNQNTSTDNNNNSAQNNSTNNQTNNTPSQPTTNPTPTPSVPQEPPQPTYKTITLNTVVNYYGFQGYFTTDASLANADLVKFGLAADNSRVARYPSEYYDVDTEAMVWFICNGEVVQYSDLMGYVDGVGRGEIPVKTN